MLIAPETAGGIGSAWLSYLFVKQVEVDRLTSSGSAFDRYVGGNV